MRLIVPSSLTTRGPKWSSFMAAPPTSIVWEPSPAAGRAGSALLLLALELFSSGLVWDCCCDVLPFGVSMAEELEFVVEDEEEEYERREMREMLLGYDDSGLLLMRCWCPVCDDDNETDETDLTKRRVCRCGLN
jgi:hypothetical protein